MSKKKLNKKPEAISEEQIQAEVKEEFIPESELIQDIGQAEAVIGQEASMTPKADEVDEANKPSPNTPVQPKRQTFQEIMADRAKQQNAIMLKNIERNKAVQVAMAKAKNKAK